MLPSCLLFLTCIILLNVSSTLLAGGGGGGFVQMVLGFKLGRGWELDPRGKRLGRRGSLTCWVWEGGGESLGQGDLLVRASPD